jgi:hypothetical protein
MTEQFDLSKEEIRCEEIVKHGLQIFPILMREEFFDKKFIPSDKVKEFIRELKENLYCKFDEKQLRFIDKLAGKELIEGEK